MVIWGTGGILGKLATQLRKTMGVTIAAVDSGDVKTALSMKLGADTFLEYTTITDIVL